MDKGKKPIEEEEEEDFLSLDPNVMILSPTPLAPPEFSIIFSEGSGSAKETSLVDEMETAKEDFFHKFLNMKFSDELSPNMNEQYSMLPTSKAADFPIPNADNQPLVRPVPPNVYTMPPREPLPPLRPLPPLPPLPPDADADDKPFVFRKIMPPDVLAEVAICDPKRAKRIVTNRLSAIRAKEKKKLYMYMLEHKLHGLQSKSAKLSARLALLQTESNSLNSEHNFLKNRMDIMRQQLHLQDSLNDQIRSEIQHLRTVLAQIAPNYGTSISLPGNSNHAMNASLATAAQQIEQLQLQNQQQVQGGNFEQQTYLGLCNFGGEYEPGECSQHQQQLQQQQNPQPYEQYQVQNEEEQPSEFEQMHAEDYSAASLPSQSKGQK